MRWCCEAERCVVINRISSSLRINLSESKCDVIRSSADTNTTATAITTNVLHNRLKRGIAHVLSNRSCKLTATMASEAALRNQQGQYSSISSSTSSSRSHTLHSPFHTTPIYSSSRYQSKPLRLIKRSRNPASPQNDTTPQAKNHLFHRRSKRKREWKAD